MTRGSLEDRNLVTCPQLLILGFSDFSNYQMKRNSYLVLTSDLFVTGQFYNYDIINKSTLLINNITIPEVSGIPSTD